MGTQIKTKKHNNKPFFLLLFVVLCVGLMLGVKAYNNLRLRNEWKKKSTPLPQDRVDILCTNFGLTTSHKLCDGIGYVYGPDFFDLIRKNFNPKYPQSPFSKSNKVPATYEQVENKIGVFKTDCESMVWYEYEQTYYYFCTYDLRGDGKYLITIGFDYPGNKVDKIIAPKGKEPMTRISFSAVAIIACQASVFL
jgi:hypothetical protein